ncbi:MAG: class I SAM-dependent methyltransferase [Acidimicrobiales bacterium]
MNKRVDNQQQDEFWNGDVGALWVTNFDENERHTSPFGNLALELASPMPAERVLDVGCGCGSSTLALATAVGESGEVLGIDISATMLARAKELTTASNFTNITLGQGDAQTSQLSQRHYDLAFSRFGVMFFADPIGAFSNVRSSLRSDGRLVFVCWQSPSANPWSSVPNRAALKFFSMEPPPHDAPGPYSLADPNRIRAILSEAGFSRIDITGATRTLQLALGQRIEDWAHERLLMGFARQLYSGSDAAVQADARRALAEALEPFRVADRLELEGAAWIVRAS